MRINFCLAPFLSPWYPVPPSGRLPIVFSFTITYTFYVYVLLIRSHFYYLYEGYLSPFHSPIYYI